MHLIELTIEEKEDKQLLRLTFTEEIKEKIDKVKDVKFVFYTTKTDDDIKITADFDTQEYFVDDELVGTFEFE